jgi:hypothetical protein
MSEPLFDFFLRWSSSLPLIRFISPVPSHLSPPELEKIVITGLQMLFVILTTGVDRFSPDHKILPELWLLRGHGDAWQR